MLTNKYPHVFANVEVSLTPYRLLLQRCLTKCILKSHHLIVPAYLNIIPLHKICYSQKISP